MHLPQSSLVASSDTLVCFLLLEASPLASGLAPFSWLLSLVTIPFLLPFRSSFPFPLSNDVLSRVPFWVLLCE